jgi:hypothetical protein
MYGNNIEQRYLHDNIFHRVVDQMRSLLSLYQITPSELREAVILAATMHELNQQLYYADWAKPPLMFGGIDPIGCVAPKKPEHCHIFLSSGYGYDVCNDCGISDVYYNWAYSKKS